MTEALLKKDMQPAVHSGDEDMRQYLSEIHRYPLLTAEQERELAAKCAAGDEEAIRMMVSSNLRLVVSVAKEYAGRGVALLDLIQEGSIGLLTAAKKYDYTRDVRFSTYAAKWIRQGIGRCLMNHGSMIRIPKYTAERVHKIRQARLQLMQAEKIEPSAEQIAARCDIPAEKVEQLLRMIPEVWSVDAPVGEDGSLGGLLEDVQTPQPYEGLVRQELRDTLENLLGVLNERQRRILDLRFGFGDGTCLSREEIGSRMGISKERVRQIEKQAMEILQKEGSSLGLEDFLNE